MLPVLFPGGTHAVSSEAPVLVLAHEEVHATSSGDGGARNSATTAERTRNTFRIRYVRHQDQFRLQDSALRTQVSAGTTLIYH